MTSSSRGKGPLDPETLNMIFNSSDLAKIWKSTDDSVASNTRSNSGGSSSSNHAAADLQKVFKN